MYYIILFLVVFSLILLHNDYKNKFSWLIVLMVMGMCISLFSVTQQIIKMGNYRVFNNPIFIMDYKFYLFMARNINLNLSNITRFINLGIVIYLLGLLLFVHNLTNNSLLHNFSDIKKIFLLSIYPIFYFWFYSPEVGYRIYIILNLENVMYANFFGWTIRTIDSLNRWLILLYLFIPLFLLLNHYKEIKSRLIKKQLLSLGLSLLIMNTFFYLFFFLSPFRLTYTNLFAHSFWNLYDLEDLPTYFQFLPIIMLVMLITIVLIYHKYRMTSVIDFFKKRIVSHNMKDMNTNIKGVLHAHKNTIFSYKIIASEIKLQYGTSKGKESLKELMDQFDVTIGNLSRVLDTLKVMNFKVNKHRIVDAIEMALNQIHVPQYITIHSNYHIYDLSAYFDLYHMSEVFTNIFINAIEAIECKGNKSGKITIETGVQYDWLYIKISDDGIGIQKKSINKIFQTFYSTKAKQSNWGVGLSYVDRVIKAHLGYIGVESFENEYTSFEVLLPLAKRKEYHG